MKGKELRNLEWIPLDEEVWKEISMTEPEDDEDDEDDGEDEEEEVRYIGQADLDAFLINEYQKMSREVGIEYEKFAKIMEQENRAFYHLKESIFENYSGLDYEGKEFEALKKLFKVPSISRIGKVECCRRLFGQLSPEEKLEILMDELITLKELIKLQTEEIERRNQ